MKQKELTVMYIKVLMFHNLEDIFFMVRGAGFEIIQISEKFILDKSHWEVFYADYKDKCFFDTLVGFSSSGPIVAAILEKENAVADFCALIGAYYGNALPDTIVDLYGNDEIYPKDIHHHPIHASNSHERVNIEIELLFPGFNIDEEIDIQQFETVSLI